MRSGQTWGTTRLLALAMLLVGVTAAARAARPLPKYEQNLRKVETALRDHGGNASHVQRLMNIAEHSWKRYAKRYRPSASESPRVLLLKSAVLLRCAQDRLTEVVPNSTPTRIRPKNVEDQERYLALEELDAARILAHQAGVTLIDAMALIGLPGIDPRELSRPEYRHLLEAEHRRLERKARYRPRSQRRAASNAHKYANEKWRETRQSGGDNPYEMRVAKLRIDRAIRLYKEATLPIPIRLAQMLRAWHWLKGRNALAEAKRALDDASLTGSSLRRAKEHYEAADHPFPTRGMVMMRSFNLLKPNTFDVEPGPTMKEIGSALH